MANAGANTNGSQVSTAGCIFKHSWASGMDACGRRLVVMLAVGGDRQAAQQAKVHKAVDALGMCLW
jgi:hypothetical protein